jgi:crotonobetaine/carnitine-CoA ligase
VFPVRSELAEDEVMAAVVARTGMVVDAGDLWGYCEARLQYFAVPRYLNVVGELPRTENGKVQKYRLREQGVTTTTCDRTAML